LKEHARDGRTSATNAVIAVVLPNRQNSYNYYIEENICSHCNAISLNTSKLFKILSNNMFNIKKPIYSDCENHGLLNKIYKGESSYIVSVKWEDFIKDMDKYLNRSLEINKNIADYEITKKIVK